MATRFTATVVLFVLTLVAGTEAMAQEGTWSLSAAAGIALLQFDEVDADGRRDVAAWGDSLGTVIGNYPALQFAPVVQAELRYRYDRDFGISVGVSYQQARTSTSHHDSSYTLSLDRRLLATVVGADISYFLPPLIGNAEAGLSIGIARMWASADQTTKETHTVKLGPGTEERVLEDAYALHEKSRLIVRATARLKIPFSLSCALTAGASYQYAKLGLMSGTLRDRVGVRPVETALEFDYSALQLTLGAEYTF